MKFEPGWSGAAWCSKENEHKEMDVVLAQEIERIANARLQEMLKDAPIAFGHWHDDGYFLLDNQRAASDTHKAKLVCIEEIGE